MILIVDNYDSFTYNLVDIVAQCISNQNKVKVLYQMMSKLYIKM